MSVPAKQSWPRRAVFAGAVLATAVLAFGVMPRPAAAQYAYHYGYPAAGYYPYSYPAYTYYPPYVYPYYSYPAYGYSYYGDGGWRSGRRGWDQGWSGRGWNHGGWRHGRRGQEADEDE
jgi:hypothetical protein